MAARRLRRAAARRRPRRLAGRAAAAAAGAAPHRGGGARPGPRTPTRAGTPRASGDGGGRVWGSVAERGRSMTAARA